jgi:hypothetical protein
MGKSSTNEKDMAAERDEFRRRICRYTADLTVTGVLLRPFRYGPSPSALRNTEPYVDTLNKHFQNTLDITRTRSSGLQAAYFGYDTM